MGSILVSKQSPEWVVAFQGDVRLSLCTTLDDLTQDLFQAGIPDRLTIDLHQAEMIDSTCLGLLAKLAMHYEGASQSLARLYCPSAELVELVQSLGLESLFEWTDVAPTQDCHPIPLKSCDQTSAQPLILDAHQQLSQLNSDNQAQFQGLISALKP